MRDVSKAPSLPSHPLPCHLFQQLPPPPPRLPTHEHVASFLEETWRSKFPVLNSSMYLKQGGGAIVLEETSGGALHSSTFSCCVREIIPFRKLFWCFS